MVDKLSCLCLMLHEVFGQVLSCSWPCYFAILKQILDLNIQWYVADYLMIVEIWVVLASFGLEITKASIFISS